MFTRQVGYCLPALALMLPSPASAEDVALDRMLVELKKALALVGQDGSGAGLPPLKSATLNASTVQKKQIGGKFKLFIIEIGASRSNELTTTVSIALAPARSPAMPVAADLQIAKQLADAILSAGRAVSAASQVQPPLVTKEIKAKIKFGVKSDGNGGITFTLAPATIGINGGVAAETTQEIEIVYGS